MNLAKIISSPEGKTLEFKRDTSALKKIMRTIVAFANTAGGTIIIGREDNGEIIGIEDPLLVEEQLSTAIADSIAPMIMPDIEITSFKGKVLLCIRVARNASHERAFDRSPEHHRLNDSRRRQGFLSSSSPLRSSASERAERAPSMIHARKRAASGAAKAAISVPSGFCR